MTFRKELRQLNKELEKIAEILNRMVAVVNQLETSEPETKSKPGPKEKVKKSSNKHSPAKKTEKSKSRSAKSAKESAIGKVLKIIEGTENGISKSQLMRKTGFDSKKVQNLISRLKKQGQVKMLGRGLYGTT
ncbi:MAG: hypothetical protein R6U50_04155 [Desulfobacterales bacterium]